MSFLLCFLCAEAKAFHERSHSGQTVQEPSQAAEGRTNAHGDDTARRKRVSVQVQCTLYTQGCLSVLPLVPRAFQRDQIPADSTCALVFPVSGLLTSSYSLAASPHLHLCQGRTDPSGVCNHWTSLFENSAYLFLPRLYVSHYSASNFILYSNFNMRENETCTELWKRLLKRELFLWAYYLSLSFEMLKHA